MSRSTTSHVTPCSPGSPSSKTKSALVHPNSPSASSRRSPELPGRINQRERRLHEGAFVCEFALLHAELGHGVLPVSFRVLVLPAHCSRRKAWSGANQHKVQRKNGRSSSEWPLPAKSFKMWCGEGDLNPHEIAPASTSNGCGCQPIGFLFVFN